MDKGQREENNSRENSSSASVVKRIGVGDQRAEAELVEKYYQTLHFILKRRCNDPQLAADIAQDAFIVVIGKARAQEINNPEAIAAFIRQTGVNLMIAHFRKETRRATDTYGEVAIEVPDHNTNVSRAVESNQTLSLVQQMIGEMKVERDRDILISYYAKEEEKSSICNRLDLTSAHFDRVLFRARARLKQLVDFKLGGINVFD
ncbi:hypothetical protein NBRC116583_02890 [Arenicella sp. 4NH20-0111]|uniref:RNA polymerase sigma factor n=1 Tax=Arenicella sp. 4NH20-0111 TaxID=3127648 RepID=UPI003103CB96